MGPLRRKLLMVMGIAATALSTGASLTFYEESLPSTMNPLFASSMVDNRVHELVFDRLYYYDPITNELVSQVVQQWELTDGGKGIRLTLKKGIKWHDGKPLTSADICFSVDAMLNPSTPSPIAEKQRLVFAGCEAEKGDVALVKFTKVFHNPLNRLGFHVLPQHVFGGDTAIQPDNEFSARPVGTGPAKGSLGRRGVNFEAFKNAHHDPKIDTMTLQEGQDPLVQVRTLLNNGVQGIIAVPPPYRADVSASDELALKSYDLRSWWFVAVNPDKPYLADKRVRQALNLLLDRTDLREKSIGVKPGEKNSPCEFISGPFVQSSPYYNRAVPTKDRSDQATAFKLLQEAGLKQLGGRWHYKGEPVSFRIGMKAPLDNEAPDLLSQVGNQLGAAGFDRQEFKITVDDWNNKVLTGNAPEYDLVIGKWSFGLVEDVNPLFHSRRSGRGAFNIFNYSNPQIDALLAQYDVAKTDTQAQDAYHKLHAKLDEELPYLFLWKLDTKSAWRTEVRGNTITPYFYWTVFDSWKFGG
ncbi:MAG: ABC transporter substrate-binding protein [Alphaproteobacteria bacterium]|nr:ABC transporter substrate-binding protein [Alphaproteobacteria bacterium]